VTDRWTFLTNHAHVLMCISQDSEIRLRDVAEKVGITERAAQRIVADLESEGYITAKRIGRRNRYLVHSDLPLRHPLEEHCSVGQLLKLVKHRSSGRLGSAHERVAFTEPRPRGSG
jgi:DNA-binding Lrp family transcriptional regulator